jgi:predicted secreted protein
MNTIFLFENATKRGTTFRTYTVNQRNLKDSLWKEVVTGLKYSVYEPLNFTTELNNYQLDQTL